MESSKRKKPQTQTENSCPSPAPNLRSSSSLFRDISNFKTPKHPSTTFSQFTTPKFTASKRTPSSTITAAGSRRRRLSMAPATAAASSKSKFSQRLKVLELEQSQSCRKELIKKEKSMKSLASSLTAWLNFLFDNPIQCGCGDPEARVGVGVGVRSRVGKREIGMRKREEEDVRVDGLGRWPKRRRDGSWNDLEDGDWGDVLEISSSQFANLQKSLSDLCSFDDLKGRMREFLSLSTCKEVFNVMTRVTKNIDEGRLKMKPHCPLVTDLGLKEKAVKALLSYNSAWLRVGLYIIFGGESLLNDGCSATDEEIGFLKMVIEKQLFSHVGLAKSFAYNKLVEGLYKPGYFEMLGNVILKRFLLLVLLLDKAKTQSCLPIKYGLDGLDGGSPLLFNVQSNIKSSQQMITDFLITEVMHGEGNLLAHLVMIGYRVSYEQLPLIEYDFRIGDLFEDIQDGVKICRAIQLLQNDSSVLLKLVLPADSYKKRLGNCNIALQYLKKAGVPLYDDDGMLITGDDIVNGDKELSLSLLWNVFVHLQIPLLITKTTLYDEICKICKANSELKDLKSSSHLDMLLNWIKAICENYGDKKDKLNSVVDGKSMWCLLDFYFHTELTCVCSPKDMGETSAEESIVSSVDRSDAVHNFVLSQKITTLLGNVPQVLQTSDILEYNGPCNNRSVIVLLVFMSTQLLVKKSKDQLNFHKLMGCRCQALERRRSNLDWLSKKTEEAKVIKDDSEETTADAARKFKAVKAWWQDMAKKNSDCITKPALPNSSHISTNKRDSNVSKEKAVIALQSHARKMSKRRNYLKTRNAISCLQVYVRAWLIMKHRIRHTDYKTIRFQESQKERENLARTVFFMVDRHNFVKLKRSALLIQSAARLIILRNQREANVIGDSASHALETCITQINSQEEDVTLTCDRMTENDCNNMGLNSQLEEIGVVVCQSQQIEDSAASLIQSHCRGFLARKHFENLKQLVGIIQRHCRGYLARKHFENLNQLVGIIQRHCRGYVARKHFVNQKQAVSIIQRHCRGCLARKNFENKKHAVSVIQRHCRGCLARKHFENQKQAVCIIQRHCRGCLSRKHFDNQKQAVCIIQRHGRGFLARKHFENQKQAISIIQRHYRGCLARKHFENQKQAVRIIQRHCRGCLARKHFENQKQAVITIQRVLRSLSLWKIFHKEKVATRSAIVIQSCLRGWLARKHFENQKQAVITIQKVLRSLSLWKIFHKEKVATRSAIVIQSCLRGWLARRDASWHRRCIVVIQCNIRCWLARRVFLSQKSAAMVIQSSLRALVCSKAFSAYRQAAIEIQRIVRGRITRARLLEATCIRAVSLKNTTVAHSENQFQSTELKIVMHAIVKLQRWWRGTKMLKSQMEAAVVIQSHFRGWIARRRVARENHLLVLIQASWRGYIARRDAKEQQLIDLRRRVQESAANVDDGMRLINRHIAALNELLSMKSLSNILRNCATLDKATGLSSNCCEILVEAGAIDILLKQIKSVSRSIPDQEILKHALSILRNLARYPYLADSLINHRESVQTVLWEMLRNKDEAYFIACDLLKRVCMRRKGVEAMHRLPFLLKRLRGLVDELSRKASKEKRMMNQHRAAATRDGTERRLKEAVHILYMIRHVREEDYLDS